MIEAADLPVDEKVYLKKGAFGYRVVHPINNEDGTINWVNFMVGGYDNLFKLLFIMAIIFLFIMGTKEINKSCLNLLDSYQQKEMLFAEPLENFSLLQEVNIYGKAKTGS